MSMTGFWLDSWWVGFKGAPIKLARRDGFKIEEFYDTTKPKKLLTHGGGS